MEKRKETETPSPRPNLPEKNNDDALDQITKDMSRLDCVTGKEKSKKNESDKTDDHEAQSSSGSNLVEKDDASKVAQLKKYMAEKLGFLDKKTEENILDEVSIDAVVRYIKSGNCKNIVVMAGAGISTSAGIPDFRSPGSGLYDNLEKYKLPHPQAIFEIGYFIENPEPFFTLAKNLFPGSYRPTPAHYFVRLLHEKGLLLRHYTQNIDGLEKVAGVPADKVVEAHGTFYSSHCLNCQKEYLIDWMKEKIFEDKIPKCEDCEGVVKPDIVFFGEALPQRFFTLVRSDFPVASLLIIMGSSLVVQPFSTLVDQVKSTVPRLLINREKAGQRDSISRMLGLARGLDFDSDKNVRDVAFLGDCDDNVRQLVEKLGWTEEFEALQAEES